MRKKFDGENGNKESEEKMAIQWLNHGKLPRTRLSSYLMQHDISQEELAKAGGLSNSTVSRLCLDTTCYPRKQTANKVLKGIYKLTGELYTYEQFWE